MGVHLTLKSRSGSGPASTNTRSILSPARCTPRDQQPDRQACFEQPHDQPDRRGMNNARRAQTVLHHRMTARPLSGLGRSNHGLCSGKERATCLYREEDVIYTTQMTSVGAVYANSRAPLHRLTGSMGVLRMDEKGIIRDQDCRQICSLSLGLKWSDVERSMLLSSSYGGDSSVSTGWDGVGRGRPSGSRFPPLTTVVSFVSDVHTTFGSTQVRHIVL